MNEAVALDFIVWAAAIELRFEGRGLLPSVVDSVPLPSRLDEPGWYVDPIFGRCDRYWDGTDWTSRVRVVHAGQVHLLEQSLR